MRSRSADPCAPIRESLRYLPGRPLPPHRYVPGRHPRPVRDRSSYRKAQRQWHAAWEPAAWRKLEDWLWGVDLFNAFFFWEAHEAWERLWVAQPKDSLPAMVLQGLIQIAAALLKVRAGSVASATTLSHAGLDKIDRVAGAVPSLFGLNLGETVANFRFYFRPLSERTLPRLDASVPLLLLSGEAEA